MSTQSSTATVGLSPAPQDPDLSIGTHVFTAEGFLGKLRGRAPGVPGRVNLWMRRPIVPDDSWRPSLNLTDVAVGLCDGRGEFLWSGSNVEPNRPQFSLWHRDVVPSYRKSGRKAEASFVLPDRPFDDDDVQSLS